jgi:hypothetical protein
MFGNKTGWILAAVIAVVLMGGVYLFAQLDVITKPSIGAISRAKGAPQLNLTTNPAMLDEIKLGFDPTSVVPSMTKAGDAGPLYRQAMAEVERAPAKYRDESRIKRDNPDDFAALKPLLEAKDLTSMNLFAAKPEEVISYKLQPEPLRVIEQLGVTAGLVAYTIKDQKHAEALALAEAEVSLGVKLCNERLRWYEFEVGHRLITEGALVMEKVEPSRAAACAAAREATKQVVVQRGMPLARAFTSIDPDVMGRTAGDMFYIVKHSKERVWRVEALLKLGHYKYNSGEPGNAADQRWAKLIAKRVMNDPSEDPVVRKAAQLSYELTKEDYLKIGSN